MDHHQQLSVSCAAHGHPSLLVFTVVVVGDRQGASVLEHGRCQIERDAVLATVAVGLGGIPLEAEQPSHADTKLSLWSFATAAATRPGADHAAAPEATPRTLGNQIGAACPG